MPESSPDGEAVPRSRRAAREAAARRAATGENPTQPSAPATGTAASRPSQPTAPIDATSRPVPAAPASPATEPSGGAPASDVPDGTGFRPVPLRTPRPDAAPAGSAGADEEPWIFASVGAEPALPYSRSGAAASPTAPRPGFESRGHPEATASGRQSTPGASPATLDALFSGSTSTEDIGDVPPPKNKRSRRVGGWIALGVVLLLLGGIAGGAFYVWTTYEDKIREVMGWEEPKDYEEGLATGEAFVTIASGDTGMPISQSLHEAGVTKTSEAFYDYLIDTGQNPTFQPGVYKLQQKMTSEAALAALMDPANKQEFTAQIPEGFTVEGTLERLAEGTGIPLADLQAAAADPAAYGVPVDPAIVAAGGQPLEGWLFPATYTFDPGVTAQSAIQTLVNRTIQSLDAAGVPAEDRQRILTTASVIQREARFEADMQKVSRVIQNRLNPDNQETFGLLQMDSTAQYGYGEMHDGTVSSSAEALSDDNPWNTYVHTGLPVGPISNPGDVAINAAMHPADGDWLYFVTVNLDTGETVFTNNLADHNRAVQQWQQWCSDHPDSGC
ncbi:endolytic transglycosylase MltG [Microbacterium timonense]|uniref:endolytic transglycosylase MltG n=1 Tax=Microbacterium timonense TaxID=2086576 RepID=UPI001F3214E1|nr:endolytic transglycosylase MltG [Microbacterium timonense]